MGSGVRAAHWKDDLSPLFQPQSIAIIGASERNHYCHLTVENIFRFDFPRERLFMVNPTRNEVYGQPAQPSIGAIPDRVDLAILVVNRDRILNAFREAVDKGVRGVVILASGFAEADAKGAEIQAEISKLGVAAQVLVCGPNCTGVADLANRSAAYDGGGRLPDRVGGVSVVSQSGGLMNPIMETLGGRAVGLRRLVSAGNAAVLGPEDYIRYFAEDPATEVIVSYVEAFKDADRAVAALELAAERHTPVVMIKAGRSARSRRAVQSHTAGLITSGLAWEGVLRQKGVVLVDNLDELVETAIVLQAGVGRRVGLSMGFVTISGGDTSLFCDIADKHGLRLPDLSPEVVARLAAMPGKMSQLGNPFDLAGRFPVGSDAFFDCFDVFAGDEEFMIVAARVNLPKAPTAEALSMVERMRTICDGHNKPFVVFSRATERWDAEWYSKMADLRVPFLEEFDKGCAALARWNSYEDFSTRHVVQADARSSAAERQREAMPRKGVLSYGEAAALVSGYEVPLAKGELSRTADEAVAIAERYGYPVVAKVDSRDVPHRSKLGGVATGLNSEEELRRAYTEILANVSAARPDAVIDGVIVQEQVRGMLEMIVGGTVDPQLGPLVMVGFGGVHVEYLKDVAVGRAPLTETEAYDLLLRLRGAQVLTAAEAGLGADIGALVQALCQTSRLMADYSGEEIEIDLNPIMVGKRGDGVLAVDVLIASGSESVGIGDRLTG